MFHLLMHRVAAVWTSTLYGMSTLALSCLLVWSSGSTWLGCGQERGKYFQFWPTICPFSTNCPMSRLMVVSQTSSFTVYPFSAGRSLRKCPPLERSHSTAKYNHSACMAPFSSSSAGLRMVIAVAAVRVLLLWRGANAQSAELSSQPLPSATHSPPTSARARHTGSSHPMRSWRAAHGPDTHVQ